MKKHDVIIVGAGPAGIAAAFVLAKAGLDVVLFERGEFPGEKNMFGGVVYGQVINELIPNYWEQAPVERAISKQVITLLSEEAAVSIELDSRRLGTPPNCGFTVQRSHFDRWFAQQAVDAGAKLVNRTVVDGLIWEDGRVIGVRARRDQGEIYAQVVIAADGVNSLLAEKAGLRKAFRPEYVNLGVKEVISLPRNVIEQRFNLSGNAGLANEYVGGLKGVHGGGFLYTNKESLSIGVVAQLPCLQQHKIKLYELLEEFKSHHHISGLIKDGVVKEYSAHLIPEAGVEMMPKLYTDGMLVVGDAAAFVLATGLNLEGVNYAIASGIAAAETINEAARNGDFSKKSLARYSELLEASYVLKDLRKFKRAPAFMANPRLHEVYPDVVCRLLENVFSSNGQPKSKVGAQFKEQLQGRVSTWQAIKDGFEAGRTLLW